MAGTYRNQAGWSPLREYGGRTAYAFRGGKWVPVTMSRRGSSSSGGSGIDGVFEALQARVRAAPGKVAQAVAPDLTASARSAYSAGRTVYGEARPRGVNGQPLSLVRSGETLANTQFRAIGDVVRCFFSADYVRFLIGKYKILPSGRQSPPVAWKDQIRRRFEEVAGGGS